MPSTLTTPLRGSARLCRVTLVGTWTMLMAMLGHRVGGGEWAPLAVAIPVAMAAAGAAWVLTGRRLSGTAVALVIGAAQVAVHLMTCYLHGHYMVPSAAMLGGHLAAAVATGCLLARADGLWWALLAPILRVWRITAVPIGVRPVRRVLNTLVPTTPLVLAHAVVRRGPPVF